MNMNKFYKSRDQQQQRHPILDTYDAEIIEDIPEQFDPNRYKKLQQQQTPYNQQSDFAYSHSNNINHKADQFNVNYASHPPQYHKSMGANYGRDSHMAYPGGSNPRPAQNLGDNRMAPGNQNINAGGYGYQQQMPNKLMQQGSVASQQTGHYANMYPQRQQQPHLNHFQYSNNYTQQVAQPHGLQGSLSSFN